MSTTHAGTMVLDVETPTAVNDSVKARVFDPEKMCIILTRGCILDVFDYDLGTDRDEQIHLSHAYRLDMNLRIDAIAVFQQDINMTDKILVLCGVTLVCLSWDPITRTFSTESVFQLVPQGLEFIDTTKVKPQIVVDHADKLVAILFGQDLDMLSIVPFDSSRKSFSIPLLSIGICHARRMTFVDSGLGSSNTTGGTFKSHLCILFDKDPTSAERFAVKKIGCAINVYNINLMRSTLELHNSITQLPFDCYEVSAVPNPVGGVIILTTSGIIHINGEGNVTALRLSHYFETSILEDARIIDFNWKRDDKGDESNEGNNKNRENTDLDEEIDVVDDYLYALEKRDAQDVKKENIPFLGERATVKPSKEILLKGAIGVWLNNFSGTDGNIFNDNSGNDNRTAIIGDNIIPLNNTPTMFMQDRYGGTYILKLKGDSHELDLEDGISLSFVKVIAGLRHKNMFGSWATYPSKTIIYLNTLIRRKLIGTRKADKERERELRLLSGTASSPHGQSGNLLADRNYMYDSSRGSANLLEDNNDNRQTGNILQSSNRLYDDMNSVYDVGYEYNTFVFLGGDDGLSQILSLTRKSVEQEGAFSEEDKTEKTKKKRKKRRSSDNIKKEDGSTLEKKERSRNEQQDPESIISEFIRGDEDIPIVKKIKRHEKLLFPFVGKWTLSKSLSENMETKSGESVIARPVWCWPTPGIIKSTLYEPNTEKIVLCLAKHGLFNFKRGNMLPAHVYDVEEPSKR